MIGSVSASRRAQAFAEALDEPGREPGHDEEAADGDHEQARLLSLADGLSALPGPQLDPDVKTVQRARLVAAMEAAAEEGTVGSGEGAVPGQRSARSGRGTHRAAGASGLGRFRPGSRLGKGLAAGGLSVGVAATAFGGAAAASGDALPGDTLYGLKLGMEDLRLGMADDDADRGRLHLDHAATRLSEATRLMERGRSGPLDHESLSDVRRALSGMKADASEGHRLLSQAYERHGRIAVMQSLSSFSRTHGTRWQSLQERLPAPLSDVGRQVSSVFDAIEQEVGPLRALFPEQRDEPSAPAAGPGRKGEQRQPEQSGPAPESPPASQRAKERQPESSASPRPSGSRSEDGRLIGEDGLIDPPLQPSDGRSGSADTAPGGVQAPQPDITLPPLLPDVLPGLGIDAEDD
ncbi:DUF5667 domain-containing protein [Streptomyces sp. JJ36]|uniref:DUF5667 domain-containing protein n=1 Tax=Streptomyces sp. JJ36 TaxID=2736645 RepID=UPI001F2F74D4|nr:DUF5667 domain-containing protein [Streptomyces sp. JJ36]MCF6526480.1 hypothetical protein [Streptomyces sp. JJ36]